MNNQNRNRLKLAITTQGLSLLIIASLLMSGISVSVAADETKAPECCGSEMKPAEDLKACGLSTTAEHSRFDDFDEPCDDGRAG